MTTADIERPEWFRTFVENVPAVLFALDEQGRFTLSEGMGLEWLGLEPGEVVGESVCDLYRDHEKIVEDVERALAGETVNAIREAGGRSFETTYEPVLDEAGDLEGVIGVAIDVTERERRHDSLAALHDATRAFLQAETRAQVCKRTVGTASDVLGLPGVLLYGFDEQTNQLVPVERASRSAFSDPPPTLAAGERSIAWTVFAGGETMSFADVRDSELLYNPETTPMRSGLFVPVGDQGVLVAASETPGVFDAHDRDLAELLATTAAAALNQVDREHVLLDQERQLRERNRQLRDLDRVNEIIRDVQGALVGASTREEIERAVAERLTDGDRFPFAWIGDVDRAREVVVPRSWAGDGERYLQEVTVSVEPGEDGHEPAGRTARGRTPTVVSRVSDGLRAEPWRPGALSQGFQSVASVPVAHEEYAYGVLTVYAERPDAFDDRAREVLEELGETVGYAINAVETRQALLAEQVVELALHVPAVDDPLFELAHRLQATVTFEGLLRRPEYVRTFFSVPTADAAAEAVLDAGADVRTVEEMRAVGERDGVTRFETVVDGELLATTLAEYGASVEKLVVEPDGADVVVELRQNADVRSFVRTVQELYPGAEFGSRRDRERPVRTREDLRGDLEATLTDRQRESLRTALLAGYFEWPRESTGEEVAASLGISQPTFNRHLRDAQRKVVEALFG